MELNEHLRTYGERRVIIIKEKKKPQPKIEKRPKTEEEKRKYPYENFVKWVLLEYCVISEQKILNALFGCPLYST